MLRKLPVFLLTAALLTGATAGQAFAAGSGVQTAVNEKIKVTLNGKPLALPQDPVSYNGITYVNASAIALALGGTAAWDTATKSVLIAKGNKLAIRMFQDNPVAYKNGKLVKVPGVARPTTGAVLVPLVFLVQELGGKIVLDTKTKTYNITIKSDL
ncbi:copper amine oxidase N-terminal domain-containing protein [Brevibacillus sp. SYP-B805]|uniref:copper amine oxidase N-terminal domain-containing protein n=1 Tax=Brevibacillus sp. SYP-B805 TaxID=1578199 RepID=UPI0013E9B991|nr:copper amine oxidase N-terminal domain-containing protein [Brevibacillus sp. SYP-B805]NGQ95085.1 copper amine oxidase N-terminal domain-containing protein [Brevibacillus sp. SYP-B805]